MVFNDLPLYEISIDNADNECGVTKMSIVDDPAVEKNFLKFDKQKKVDIKLSFNEEKRIVTGVALRADYPIYRNDNGNEYYVTFPVSAIEKIVCKFMKEQRGHDVNVFHDTDVSGIYLFESFLLNDYHKISYPEFEDISNGSWITSYKVENDKVWSKIKSGELNGFSVELTSYLLSKQHDNTNNSDIYELINFLQYENIHKN